MPRIFRNEEIERIAEARLSEYVGRHGKIKGPKIPLDAIIEDCGLNILYERISENPGEQILGGLDKVGKIIIINEVHLSLFQEKPGLERSTKAHELGHWEIFATKNDQENSLFDSLDSQGFPFRNSGNRNVSIITEAWTDKDIYDVYKRYSRRQDRPNVASAVDRYANSLLLPKDNIKKYTSGVDLTEWRNLYKLADAFEVTISALRVRLERLGMIYVKDRKIYKTKEEVVGQGMFKY